MLKHGRHRLLGPAALAAGAVVILGTALAPAAEAAQANPAAARPDACVAASYPIEVDGFAFAPAAVVPGGSSTADLITTNCTDLSIASVETWTGQWLPLNASGAVPTGCPIIDPIAKSVDYGPNAEVAVNQGYYVPPGCTAAELVVTVRISAPAGVAGITTSAILHIIQPVG